MSDAENRLETRTLPNGVVTTYTYDSRDRPLSVVHRNASNVVLMSRTYVRAPDGEPTRITKQDGSYVEIGYDAALRITSERYYTAAGVLEEELGYTYDADGNRLTKTRNGVVSTYSYAAGSRLVGVSTEGELEARVTDNGGRETALVVDGRQLSLTYDSDDHVTRVVDGPATTDFAFDGAGRRVGVTTAGGSKRFLTAPNTGDGFESPQAVTDAGGAVIASYVLAGEMPLAKITASGTEYYLTDEIGSVIGTADSSGALLSALAYDAFGNELDGAAVSSATHGDFRLHGMWKDPSGLYCVRARMYDAEAGRFTSRDPAQGTVRYPESLLAYSFANANPAFWIDPSGEFVMVGGVLSAGRSALASLSIASARAIFVARAVAQAAAVLCTASYVGSAIAQSSGASVPQGICVTPRGYLIVDGVRRAKAHHIIGRDIVIAAVVNQGYLVQAIPLDLLYSPKPTIPDWMRFNKILEEVGTGGAAPIEVQQVSPPTGTPIRDVKVLGPRGRPIYR